MLIKFALLYTLYYFASGMAMNQYIPFLSALGYDALARGLLISSYAFVSFLLQLVLGYLSDRFKTVRLFVVVSVVIFGVGSVLLYWINQPLLAWQSLLIALSGGVANANYGSLDNWVFESSDEMRGSFSFIRMFGSLGWGIGSLVGPWLVGWRDYRLFGVVVFAMSLWTLALTIRIPDAKKAARGGPEISLKDVRTLLAHKKYVLLTISLFLLYCLSNANGVLVVDKMLALNASDAQIGMKYAVVGLIEIPTYFFGARLLKRLNPYRLLLISGLLISIQFVSYALASNAWEIIWIGALQIGTGPLMMLCAKSLIYEYSDARLKSTGQFVSMSIFNGLSTLLMPTVLGYLSSRFGTDVSLLLMVVFGVVGTLLALLLYVRAKQEQLAV